MSVLIKGMEMPEGCADCYLCMEYGECGAAEYKHTGDLRWRHDRRPDWCPLVPVPPHGRLIDADALPFPRVEWEDIEYAPTIIEAEE